MLDHHGFCELEMVECSMVFIMILQQLEEAMANPRQIREAAGAGPGEPDAGRGAFKRLGQAKLEISNHTFGALCVLSARAAASSPARSWKLSPQRSWTW